MEPPQAKTTSVPFVIPAVGHGLQLGGGGEVGSRTARSSSSSTFTPISSGSGVGALDDSRSRNGSRRGWCRRRRR